MLKCCYPGQHDPDDTSSLLQAGEREKSHEAPPYTRSNQEPEKGSAEQPAPSHSLPALGTVA